MPATGSRRDEITDVLARVDLAGLMDELVAVSVGHGTGRRWQCPDPAHPDAHPSVTVRAGRDGQQRWSCWSGGHRGDALDLVRLTRGFDHRQALDWLTTHTGLTTTPPRPAAVVPAVPVGPSPVVARYVRLCERVLWGPQGRPARHWLHARGFNDEILRVNHVGFDLGRDRMRRTRGLPPGFTPAVTFPLHNPTGDIVYVQARTLDPTARAKYINPSSTLAANPRISWTQPPPSTAASPPAAAGVLVVCEGIPDALIATQAGFRSVAVIGTWTADRTVGARLALEADDGAKIVALFDNDPAGRDAATRLARLLDEHGHPIDVIHPPVPGFDLNDWARHDPRWPTAITDPTSTPTTATAALDGHHKSPVAMSSPLARDLIELTNALPPPTPAGDTTTRDRASADLDALH